MFCLAFAHLSAAPMILPSSACRREVAQEESRDLAHDSLFQLVRSVTTGEDPLRHFLVVSQMPTVR